MNILITGGCGFIGLNLIKSFIYKENCKLRIIDNLSIGKETDLDEICNYKIKKGNFELWENGVELVIGDILDSKLLKNAFMNTDFVVHLAANTGVIPSIENPEMDFQNNVIGTFNVLEACRINNIGKVIFASSGAPLGAQTPPIHEEKVPKPISPYGASKLCGEAYCSTYYSSFGIETVALRFGNVYGPGSYLKGSVVAKFIKQIINNEDLIIYGTGKQTRDFIFTEDLCEAVIASINTQNIGGEIFQIATNKEHTVLEIAESLNNLAEKYLNKKSNIIFEDFRKGEVLRNYSDTSKAKRMLNWQAKHSLEEGLEKTFKWFLKNYKTGSMNGTI